ncbi:hypothetical protein HHK36_022033 [Tetracentron sinense]|uniref:PGG domain-containing protein n=1 Tax=Tetracentron sinense TaxID=13715 RepID=A0A834YMG9_TETSI|nr:hypothetical protein HHK36_022033 [Tetracentron sinense]
MEDADLIKKRADRIKERPDLIKKHTDLMIKNADLMKDCADLIKKRADLIKEVKEENPNLLLGVTPTLRNNVLHIAAKVGDRDLVEEVYDEQCESLLSMTNSKGDTALHIAARSGHLSIVNFLVEKSISASTSIDVEQGGNQTNYIRVLTEKAPELWCVVNKAGESPLYLAAKGGLREIVGQVLLESSHRYAHGGPNGLTALHATVIWGRYYSYDITKLLVEKKTELIKEQDIYGRTVLQYVASYDKYKCVEVAKLLLEKDSSVAYIQDKDGRSPLHFAAGKGSQDVTREIIGRYPDAVDLVDNRGQNAFHVCIGKGPEEMLDCLMRKVRDDEVLNQQDNDGNTPLHLAVKRGNPKLVKSMLTKKGRVDTDTMNKDNFTPLDLAIRRDHASKQEIQVYEHLRYASANFGIVEPFDEKGWDLANAQKDTKNNTSDIIKEISSNQMIVAALIATVTFAAAFQVPGGYNSNDGTATLAKKVAFQVFVVTDAIALSCSMTAVFLCFIFTLIRERNDDSHVYEVLTIMCFTILILIAGIAMFTAFVAGLTFMSRKFTRSITKALALAQAEQEKEYPKDLPLAFSEIEHEEAPADMSTAQALDNAREIHEIKGSITAIFESLKSLTMAQASKHSILQPRPSSVGPIPQSLLE